MIYKRNAVFPYPLLTNQSTSYKENVFNFECDLKYSNNKYIFEIICEIGSSFIVDLLSKDKASLYLIIDSMDSQFYKLQYNKDNKYEVSVFNKMISIKKSMNLQLMIKCEANINFKENYDLINFYDNHRDKINLLVGNVLGFSNIISFNGSMKKPLILFDKRIDPDLDSDIAFDLNGECITIVYRKEEYSFNNLNNSRNLNNMYLYIGLQKALQRFINNYLKEEDDMVCNAIIPDDNLLDKKIYALLESKDVERLNDENIDEVITRISDNLVAKYNSAVRGLTNGS